MPITASVQRANHGSHFRAFGLRGAARLIDPFIAVDHAWMSAPTFAPHSHAGISAVSYLFLDSETGIDNRDSIGTHNLILPGGLHWAAAGRGIVHEEVPAVDGRTVHSLQIFVNLGPDLQKAEPFTLSLEPQDVPVFQLPGVKVRVPLGEFCGVRSPLEPPTPVMVLDVSLDEGMVLTIPVAAGHSAFVLPIFGCVEVDGQSFDLEQLRVPVYEVQDHAAHIRLGAPRSPVKAVVFSGEPLLAKMRSPRS